MLNRILYASLTTVIVVALNASAGAWFEKRDAKLQSIKTVGIISAIGDQFTFVKAGLTGLENSSRATPIEPWGLDNLIVQRASAILGARFQVQVVNYNRAAFASVADSAIAPVNMVQGDPFKKLVRTGVSPQGLDAYVLVTKAKASLGGSGRKVQGVGLVTYGTMLESYNQIYALYEIRVIDGKTFDVIAKMTAAPLDNTAQVKLPGPSRLMEGRFSGNEGDTHREVEDLIVRSLPITLSDMRLTDAP